MANPEPGPFSLLLSMLDWDLVLHIWSLVERGPITIPWPWYQELRGVSRVFRAQMPLYSNHLSTGVLNTGIVVDAVVLRHSRSEQLDPFVVRLPNLQLLWSYGGAARDRVVRVIVRWAVMWALANRADLETELRVRISALPSLGNWIFPADGAHYTIWDPMYTQSGLTGWALPPHGYYQSLVDGAGFRNPPAPPVDPFTDGAVAATCSWEVAGSIDYNTQLRELYPRRAHWRRGTVVLLRYLESGSVPPLGSWTDEDSWYIYRMMGLI